MAHLLLLNGPNLNLLGTREPELYGRATLPEIEAATRAEATRLGASLEWMQTNHEGALVDAVQGLHGRAAGAIINAAAFTQPAEQRRWPRWLNVLGALGCLTLVVTLPWQSVLAGTVMFAVGLAGRAAVLAAR